MKNNIGNSANEIYVIMYKYGYRVFFKALLIVMKDMVKQAQKEFNRSRSAANYSNIEYWDNLTEQIKDFNRNL
jgi:hypothetical protein